MFCSNCGSEVKGSFCEKCGKQVGENVISNQDGENVINSPNTHYNSNVQENSNMQNTPKRKKKSGCLIVFLIFVGLMGGSLIFGTYQMSKNPDKSNTQDVEKDEKAQTLSKKEAKSIDKTIWKYAINAMKLNNNVMNQMTLYSEGSLSDVELYDICKEGEDYLINAWGSFPSFDNKDATAYGNSVKDYILFEQTLVQSIMKYLDTKKTSDLSKVQENINSCNQAAGIVSSNRGVFLGIYNFSDEEIKKLADKISDELAD